MEGTTRVFLNLKRKEFESVVGKTWNRVELKKGTKIGLKKKIRIEWCLRKGPGPVNRGHKINNDFTLTKVLH